MVPETIHVEHRLQELRELARQLRAARGRGRAWSRPLRLAIGRRLVALGSALLADRSRPAAQPR